MSFENQTHFSYFAKGIKFCRELARLLHVWRTGVSDDRLEGVELGVIRAASYPVLSRIPTKRQSRPISPFIVAGNLQTNVSTVQDSKAVTSNLEESLIPSLISPTHEAESSCSFLSNTEESTLSCLPSVESFSSEEEDEFNFLIRFANSYLNKESQLKEQDLMNCVDTCSQGAIPCLLLNALQPETVDIRALNIPTCDHELSDIEKKQNHILCVNSLAAVSHVKEKDSLDPEKLVDSDKKSILNLLRRIVDSATLGKIDVHRCHGLRALQEDEEDISHFLDQSPEELLVRWVNYKLTQSEDYEPIENIAEDLIDCSIYLKLQNEFQPDLFNLDEALKDIDIRNRAQLVLSNCSKLGIKISHSVNDLLTGNLSTNSVFLSQLFLSNPGLEVETDSTEDDLGENAEKENDEGSREERTFRMWMNSLGCDTNCISLFSESFRTGWMLLEVIDSIEPNVVDWSKTFQPPFKPVVKRIKAVENCNQVIQVAKDSLNLSLVGIGGDDIADGKKKPILALVWQLLRLHTLRILDIALESAATPRSHKIELSKNGQTKRTKLNESDVLSWANHMLDLSGSDKRINSFKDPVLSNSIALLDLLKAIEPHSVQDKHITQGITSEEKEMNAKYVLSVARKLGATIFIIWEDITEVKPKMILLLIASFMLLDKQRRKKHRAANFNNRISKSISSP
eukprot:g8152.t1